VERLTAVSVRLECESWNSLHLADIKVSLWVVIESREMIIFYKTLICTNTQLSNMYHNGKLLSGHSISQSGKHTTGQLWEITWSAQNGSNCAMEIEKHMAGRMILNSEKSSIVVSIVFNSVNDHFANHFLNEVLILLNTCHIHQSAINRVRGNKYLILGLSGTNFLVHQVWVLWINIRWWVWNSDRTGVLMADYIGLSKMVTWVGVTMVYKLQSEKIVEDLLWSIL